MCIRDRHARFGAGARRRIYRAMSGEMRSGGCLCGQVRYTVPAEPLATAICHCRNCQKQSGSAFSVVTVFPRDALIVEGTLTVYEDRGTSGQTVFRQFCGVCGSPVLTDTERAREQGIICLLYTSDAADERSSVD